MDNTKFQIHFIVTIVPGKAILLFFFFLEIIFYEKWFSHFAVLQSAFNLVIPSGQM